MRFLRYDDESLFDIPVTRRNVLNAIRWASPDLIFTHYPNDKSTDNAVTSKLVTEVILFIGAKNVPSDERPVEKAPSIFFFDTSAGIGFLPEAYVDITEVMDVKREAIKRHACQGDSPLDMK